MADLADLWPAGVAASLVDGTVKLRYTFPIISSTGADPGVFQGWAGDRTWTADNETEIGQAIEVLGNRLRARAHTHRGSGVCACVCALSA